MGKILEDVELTKGKQVVDANEESSPPQNGVINPTSAYFDFDEDLGRLPSFTKIAGDPGASTFVEPSLPKKKDKLSKKNIRLIKEA